MLRGDDDDDDDDDVRSSSTRLTPIQKVSDGNSSKAFRCAGNVVSQYLVTNYPEVGSRTTMGRS